MLGWHISLKRQLEDERETPASFESKDSDRLAVWQTGLSGTDWLDELAKAGKITDLGGNGYPLRWTGTAEVLLGAVGRTPPGAKEHWVAGPDDVILPNWAGKTTFDEAVVADCAPDEWLIVEAWDES